MGYILAVSAQFTKNIDLLSQFSWSRQRGML